MPEQSRVIAGRYELTAPIKRGGMGEVWRGYDTVLDRDIAVKLIRPQIVASDEDREELVGRFRREARVTAKVEHPGVPAVYDAAFDGTTDQLFIVMQLVHGVSVSDVLAEQGAVSAAWAASIGAQICSVLSYAHAVPIVHRDLKPGNVMIARGGVVKVLDFGIAALLRNDVTKLTSTGRVVGTKPYMSPEQIRNLPVTPQTDLYALGCLLHEMLSGQRAFDAEDEIALMYQHLEEQPRPLRELDPRIPGELEQLVFDLLAKHPADRPENAWVVYDRLSPLLPAIDRTSPDGEQPDGVIPDPTRPYRRPAAPRPRPADRPEAPVPASSVHRVDNAQIEEALAAAESLIDEERFTQASDLLSELLPGASSTFGAESAAVVDLRVRVAAALFLGGDYRRAAPEFDALAVSVAKLDGPDSEEVLDYRRQAVVCRIALGESARALAELESILSAYERVRSDGREYLELRLSLARLRLGVGQDQLAHQELRELSRDARDRLGGTDELTLEIAALLARLQNESDD
ncbi:serine/threonine protein kinase [Kribbella pittospori]|uniref:non-specific serine/threonine protein kinase n=1 Tax=Kribbella pittospori TaxID=722689 RepID=A0A4R0K776_9ACTN|nr:serine/threonine-protein kinase [Kribbella pittospori]TCC55991.1 serine/threonine protein kinase [Kribbella pittospori]